MAFCKIVIANVGSIDSCKYIIENLKVKKSVIKTGCEQKISKKLQLLEQKIAFSNANIRPCVSPPPPKKNLAKTPFDQKKAPGLIIGILRYVYIYIYIYIHNSKGYVG